MTVEAVFTRFPTLATARLNLRPVQPADAEAIFAFKSDLEVTRHYGQEPHRSLSDTQAWIERLRASYEQRDALAWCLALKTGDPVLSAAAIGVCLFWNFEPGFHCAEIGYELNPAYGRQGLMAEALAAVIACGFNELGLHRIEANPLAENTASQKLLLKLGFAYEGNLRQRCFFRGQFMDQLYFGLLRADWLKAG